MQLQFNYLDTRQTLSNKVDSFYDKDFQKKRKSQKEIVYDAIESLGFANDRDVSKFTGLSLSIVPDRRSLLLKSNRIEIAYNDIDPDTNKMTVYYKVK